MVIPFRVNYLTEFALFNARCSFVAEQQLEYCLKWFGKFRQSAKVYPTVENGYGHCQTKLS
jgi:hypothetical protein